MYETCSAFEVLVYNFRRNWPRRNEEFSLVQGGLPYTTADRRISIRTLITMMRRMKEEGRV